MATKKRPVIRSVDRLIERFFDINTSIEEAHGLLNVIATGRHSTELPGIGLVSRSDRVKIVRFLCEAGNEVDVHPSLSNDLEDRDGPRLYAILRHRARVLLARHAIPSLESFHYEYGDVSGQSAVETICRFYAVDNPVHWDIRYSRRDCDGLRDFFHPRNNVKADDFRRVFYLALTNIGLTDVLVTRRDIGAIPILSDWLGDFKWAGTKEKMIANKPDLAPTYAALPEDWVDIKYDFASHQWLTRQSKDSVQAMISSMDFCLQCAGFVLAHADPYMHPHAPVEHVEVASSLTRLCAMAKGTLRLLA